MDRVAWSVCSAFLNKQGAQKKEALLNYLPENEKLAIKSMPLTEKDPLKASFDAAGVINSLHHSWLIPFIKAKEDGEIALYLAALDPKIAVKIQKELLFSKPLPQLSATGKKYINSILLHYLTEGQEDFLPKELLPHSPLTSLLDLSVEQLKAVIEYLGLHDLAVEMKQIIDTSKIKKLHSALPLEAQNYLSHLLAKKEPVIFKKLELNQWDGKSDSLKKVITHRGINRLAKALHYENSMLRWHIIHRLPMQEAALIESLCKPLEHPKAAALLVHQILEVMPITQKQTPRNTL